MNHENIVPTILEAISDDVNHHEIVMGNYSDHHLINPLSPLFQNKEMQIGMDSYENDYPEIDVIEVPVVKRIVFQFYKPVELKFS